MHRSESVPCRAVLAVVAAWISWTVQPAARAEPVRVTQLHAFHHVPNDGEGMRPGTVAVGQDGDLYGTTSGGGTYGAGTIFRVHADGQFETLYTFEGPDGSSPDRCLLPGADGNLYGTTGIESFSGKKKVFRITTSGVLSTVATLYAPTAVDDRWSVLVRGTDQRIYAVTNSDGFSFELATQAEQDAQTPVVQVVPRLVGFTGIMAPNKKGLETVLADASRAGHATAISASVLCGETVPSRDGHLWRPLVNGSGIGRSVPPELGAALYGPVPMFSAQSVPGHLVENPDYADAAGAYGRFAEASDGSVLATSRRTVNGKWRYEVIAVTATGQIAQRIPLDVLGSASPVLGVVRAKDGYIYGLAQGSGSAPGNVLFRFSEAGGAQIVYRFSDASPFARIRSPLAQGDDGTMYVTFVDGGKDQQGVIFRVALL